MGYLICLEFSGRVSFHNGLSILTFSILTPENQVCNKGAKRDQQRTHVGYKGQFGSHVCHNLKVRFQ